ncbi:MAG: helix-turn-helix domain-containing protein [Chromatiaceae bacterium]|jgi:AraC-like DNA-binding protein|nr:helix-turn-helix domain-containing protein [Chromatiaceae bacterium]
MPQLLPTVTTRALSVFDPDELTEAVGSSNLMHTQVSSGAFAGELRATQLGSCRLDSGEYNQTLIARGAFPAGHVIVGYLLNAREPGRINGFRFAQCDVVVFPQDVELDYFVPADTWWAALQIPRTLLEDARLEALPTRSAKVVPGSDEGGRRLGRVLRELLGLLQSHAPASAVDAETQAQTSWLESRLFDAVCDVLPHRSHAGARPQHVNRMQLLRRFERLVQDHAFSNLRIADVAAQLGVSQRTLEQGVKDYIGLSPIQYLIRLRLNAVHRALMRGSEDVATVDAIATTHGVTHLGRFSAYYRQQFGCNPSETLRARYR